MVNYFIYAKDFSGSTDNVEFYHNNGLKTLEQFKYDVKKIKQELLTAGEPPTESVVVYLHWSDKCLDVNEEIIRKAYLQRKSSWMGTEPECMIIRLKEKYITNKNDKIKLLYIITDGLIDSYNAERCFKLNKKMNYEKVVFHAFNEDLTQIDLSVATSFLKGRCMVYRNYELNDDTDISKDFDYDNININNFATEKDQLKSYVKLKFIKTFKPNAVALKEIDKLKKLRQRLFNELLSKTMNNQQQKLSKVNFETKEKDVFLREFVNTDWYKNLTTPVYDEKVDIEKSISTLINYIVSDSKSFSFDALKFDTKFDRPVVEEQMVDVNFTPEQEIEFPDIILDDEKGIPVVILTTFNLLDKIIFHKTQSPDELTPASFSKFKSIMECPLFMVNDKDISESIGYFYTLNVYKQFLANNQKNEPRTRRPFHGGLVLTDTGQFDKYNDYILSATYFDCKKIHYNVGLFYFVLWKNCENKEWMDKNVVEQFKKYAMRRISKTVCKIGLSSLPLDPQENTSLLSALWYCVELSSSIFKNDPQNYKHERLRGYVGVARYMIEILQHFNYDLDLESIEKRRELLSHVTILKKIQERKEKFYYLLQKIFKTVDGFLVSEIENPCNLYKLNYLKLNHKEMLPDDVVEEKVHLNDYVHLIHFVGDLEVSKAGKSACEISEKTYRPFFAIDQNKSFYTELFEIAKKVVINNDDDKDKMNVTYEAINSLEFNRIVSAHKLFIDCVKVLKKYPTLPEYAEYVSKKRKFYEDLVTVFPSNVYLDIKNVYESYQNIVEKVDVSEFIRVSAAYASRIERIKGEGRVKFSTDKEIHEFIASEELKVNLIKKI